MNNRALVKLSNVIGVIAIIALVYWVFVFISITVFGLKVFKENITETFYLSIVGILALMIGSLITNVMFNLTRIAEKHNQDAVRTMQKNSKKTGILFALSFPLLFFFLFGGDYLTAKQKEKMLIASAKSIIEANAEKSNKLVNYSFNKRWIAETSDILELYSKTDKHFPTVSVIVADTLSDSRIFLGFRDSYGNLSDTLNPTKKDYIHQTTKEERDYLTDVFFNNLSEVRFSAYNGYYELFYPYFENEKKIVLYFSDYQRYGKLGSY